MHSIITDEPMHTASKNDPVNQLSSIIIIASKKKYTKKLKIFTKKNVMKQAGVVYNTKTFVSLLCISFLVWHAQ